jgi:hypothetical protein
MIPRLESTEMRPDCKVGWGFPLRPASERRQIMDVKENLTPSVQDAHFADQRAAAEKYKAANKRKAVNKRKAAKSGGPLVINDAKAVNLCERLFKAAAAINEHLEERITCFLFQLIDCHETDRHFTIGKTELQTKATPELVINGKGRKKAKVSYNAAHHGTLPCIYAYPREKWKAWKEGGRNAKEKPKGVVYLKNSKTYLDNNACTGLEAIINKADIAIDGNHTEKHVELSKKPRPTAGQMKLREFSIGLLNQVALGEISVEMGFGSFLKKLKGLVTKKFEEIEAGLAKVDRGQANLRAQKEIFTLWKDTAIDINTQYTQSPKLFIARMIGLDLPKNRDWGLSIAQTLQPALFDMIKIKNRYQSHISYLVDQVVKEIFPKKAPDQRVRKVVTVELLQQIQHLDMKGRRPLEVARQLELFGWSSELTTADENAKKVINAKKAIAKIGRGIISSHAQRICDYINNLYVQAVQFQGFVLDAMRMVNGFTKEKKFVDRYNKKVDQAKKIDVSEFIKLCQGEEQLTSGQIARFAHLLKIPKGIFTCLPLYLVEGK